MAAALDANRRTVYKRLRTLVDRGELRTKETGSNSRVWWRPPPDASSPPATGSDPKRKPHRGRGSQQERDDWRRTLFERAPDGIVVHDGDGSILNVNETFAEMVGYPRETLRSMDVADVEAGIDERTLRGRWERMGRRSGDRERFEGVHRRADGSTYPVEVWVRGVSAGGGWRDRFVAFVRDVTERQERERELRETARQLQGILDTVEAAIFLKDTDSRYLLMNRNCRDLFGIAEGENVVGMIDEDFVPEDSAAQFRADDRRALEAGETIEIEEEVPTTNGVRTHLTRKTPLFDEDGEPYAVCAVATDIEERKAYERDLERQREQLDALNQLSRVVHDVTDAVVDQSTRQEIEQVVAERLASADAYRFAWIGTVDSRTNSVELRVEAGISGCLEEAPISTDPTDPKGRGPTGTAVTTGEMQIARNVRADDDYEPWHEFAREYGYRSFASIPIVHDDTLYGVIGIASAQPDGFEAEEREVVGRLGEVVGHAIDAVERKRALLNDEVVELGFRIHDLENLELPRSDDGTVVFDRIVPLGDGSYIEYGTATGDAMDAVRTLVDAVETPHEGPVTVIDSTGDETHFEVRLVDPSLIPSLVDGGGYVHDARIEDGKYTIVIHLPPDANVPAVIDAVTTTFPAAEMITRRQTVRETSTPELIMETLDERLTDRQQASLEAAYAMGFFEWPRRSSGEDVADSLGVGSSTFHQHLRKAQTKLLDVVFEGP